MGSEVELTRVAILAPSLTEQVKCRGTSSHPKSISRESASQPVYFWNIACNPLVHCGLCPLDRRDSRHCGVRFYDQWIRLLFNFAIQCRLPWGNIYR